MDFKTITSFFNDVSKNVKDAGTYINEKFTVASEKMGGDLMIKLGMGLALPGSIVGYFGAISTGNADVMMGTLALGAAITYPLIIGGTLQLERENARRNARAVEAMNARQNAPGNTP
jgi:hypothetical protein